jgi:hypothetical protein
MPPEIQLLSPDKTREPDDAIRLIHVESLLLLGTTFAGREHMRSKNVYRVVQMLHKAEKDEQVCVCVWRDQTKRERCETDRSYFRL